MTDFGPLLANPRTLLLGAAAQFGIFATVLGALTLNYFGLISFTLPQAAAIGIIGGADGPTAIYLSGKLAPELLGAIAVAAYSYMALVPLIQPLKFLENRHNPAAFEPLPQAEAAQPVAKAEKPAASGIYTVEVEGKAFVVKVSDGGDISQLTAASSTPVQAASPVAPAGAGTPVTAPLAGNIWKVIATEGQNVAEGDVLLILEAMKMETEIRAAQAGTVRGIAVKSGDAVSVGDTLMTLA